jgi:outer membrane protein assembly factor BamB
MSQHLVSHRFRLFSSSILCVLCVFVVNAFADWPIFRGNALQNGVADTPLPDKLEILWKTKVKDSIESTAAIVGETVYFGSFDEHLYAVSLTDGKEKWKYKAGPIKAAPSVYKNAVYVGDEEGMFHCVDMKTGTRRWTFETGGEITSGANFTGDRVLVGSHDSTLYCLTLEGKLAWKFKTEGPVNGSPVVAKNLTFVAGCDSNLHVVDVAQGKELAKIDLDGQAGATAAVVGQQLYVGTMANQVKAVDLVKNDILWTYEPNRAQPFYASAAVTDNLVIVGGRDKLVHALDRAKGTATWTFATKGRVDSSPVVVGNRVYVGSMDGHLYVLDADKGTELQRLDLGQAIVAGPAVASNRLVIGTTDGSLYCLGKKQ